MRILIAGISGYVGGTLAPRLVEAGHDVVGLSRDPARTRAAVEARSGDLASGRGVREALEGVEVAYYLAHSLESGNTEGFASRDRRMAENFVAAARDAGVRRVVYLGAFDAQDPADRTPHKSCRLEVEEIIRGGGVDAVALRSSGIIDANNWFWRALVTAVARLPVVVVPLGRRGRVQPIDGRDVAACLAAAATTPPVTEPLDIAAPDVLTQHQFIATIAELMRRRRLLVRLPFKERRLVPRLIAKVSSTDPGLIVPNYASWFLEDVARNDGAARLGVRTTPVREAMRHALAEMGHLRASAAHGG